MIVENRLRNRVGFFEHIYDDGLKFVLVSNWGWNLLIDSLYWGLGTNSRPFKKFDSVSYKFEIVLAGFFNIYFKNSASRDGTYKETSYVTALDRRREGICQLQREGTTEREREREMYVYVCVCMAIKNSITLRWKEKYFFKVPDWIIREQAQAYSIELCEPIALLHACMQL